MDTGILQLSLDQRDLKGTKRVVDMLSRTWTIPVIQFLETHNESNFNGLKRAMKGVTPRTLSRTLTNLVHEGILQRKVVPSYPPSVQYSLTDKGNDLISLVNAINDWNYKWQNVLIPEIKTPDLKKN